MPATKKALRPGHVVHADAILVKVRANRCPGWLIALCLFPHDNEPWVTCVIDRRDNSLMWAHDFVTLDDALADFRTRP